MTDAKVSIGQPVYGHLSGLSHVAFSRLLGDGIGKGLIHYLHHTWAAYIDHARNQIVKEFLETDATHLLFVDQDMVVPQDALDRLLKHDLPVVSGLYFLKQWPHPLCAFDLGPPFKLLEEYERDALQQVDGVGMGCCLIRRDVLVAMAQRYRRPNWFQINLTTGEDVWFCRRLKKMGIPVHLDASVECLHIGDMPIGSSQHKFATRDKKRLEKKNGEPYREPGPSDHRGEVVIHDSDLRVDPNDGR